MDDFKRNQIPAFGNWDFSDGLPITQYFESARQAGLVRYSCGERDLYGAVADDSLYSNPPHSYQHDLIKPPSITVVSRRKTKGGVPREKRYSNNNNNNSIKEQKKHGRVCDVTEPAKHHQQQQHHSSYSHDDDDDEVEQYHHQQRCIPHPQRIPKAVDEDLYKIPPELLYKPKRNKMLGFFSCLVPTCAA